MAKAIYEKRQFDDRMTGEIRQYDFYGIVGFDEQGTRIELPLKSLNAAEKISFKMIATMEYPEDVEILSRKTNSTEEAEFRKKNFLDDEEED